MPALKHVHTYERKKNSKKGSYWTRYRCVDPDCSHWIKNDDLLGKRAKCKCGELFIIDNADYYFSRAELKCIRCSDSARARQQKAAEKLMGSLFISEIDANEIPSGETVLKVPALQPHQGELQLGQGENQLLIPVVETEEESEVDWDD